MTRALAEIPVISPLFQSLLNGIGWVLAQIYDLVGNYGVAIVILTILIRVILLPLGIKQIKSMQAMQAVGPKVKELQKKYKGNKAKINEETMKLYSQYGVNPFGGCLPMLLTFPFLIAMYSILRAPSLVPAKNASGQAIYEVHNSHLPIDSELFRTVITHEETQFLGLDLACSASQAGTQAGQSDSAGEPLVEGTPIAADDGSELPFTVTASTMLDCGQGIPTKIPYFMFLILMIGSTFYQQRQMQKASPPGAMSQQQQAIMKVMPVMFGVFGFQFASGLVIYWTVSNLLQIGQQYGLLKAGHIGPDALERRAAQQATRPQKKPGRLASMMDQAAEERKRREAATGKRPTKPGASKGGKPGASGQKKPAPGSKPTPKKKKPGGSGGKAN